MVFSKFSFRSACVKSAPVSSICPTIWLYSPNSLSYVYISSHWPTEAAACFVGISCGLPSKESLPIPIPIAPEDTSTISFPAFFKSLNVFTSSSTCLIFRHPVGYASVEVPTFTTTLIFLSFLILLPDRICSFVPSGPLRAGFHRSSINHALVSLDFVLDGAVSIRA